MSVSSFPLIGTPTRLQKFQAEPYRRQAAGLLEGGADVVIDRGAPQWKLSATTSMLDMAGVGVWRGWRSALRGAARFVKMWDPSVEYPSAYMPAGNWPTVRATGGGAFDGSAGIANITTSGLPDGGRDVFRITTLPVGLTLNPGDAVEVDQSTLVSLHRILDPAPNAADAGGNLTVWVEPGLPASFTGNMTVQLHRASAKWRITQCDIPLDGTGGVRPGQVTIAAVSVTR
jgi:hypothetical protein